MRVKDSEWARPVMRRTPHKHHFFKGGSSLNFARSSTASVVGKPVTGMQPETEGVRAGKSRNGTSFSCLESLVHISSQFHDLQFTFLWRLIMVVGLTPPQRSPEVPSIGNFHQRSNWPRPCSRLLGEKVIESDLGWILSPSDVEDWLPNSKSSSRLAYSVGGLLVFPQYDPSLL